MPDAPRAGDFLVATESLTDPNFSGTVVLLCEHDEQGSLGLVLNRPIQVELKALLSDTDLGGCEAPVYWGGPVKADALHALRDGPPSADSAEVYPGLAFGGNLEELLAADAQGVAVRFYMGYTGWSATQLEDEISQQAWHVLRPHPEHVFTTRPDALWGRLMSEVDPAWSHFRHRPENPDWN